MHKKFNKKIVIGGVLATVLSVAALSATHNVVENTDLLGNEALSAMSASTRTLHTQDELDAAFAPWVSSFETLSGGVGVRTTADLGLDWGSTDDTTGVYTPGPSGIKYAYVDIFHQEAMTTTTIDVTGMETFQYLFIEDGTYDVSIRVSFADEDPNQDALKVSLGKDIAGVAADSAVDSIYEPWISSYTEVKEGTDVIGFTTTGEVDISAIPTIKSVELEIVGTDTTRFPLVIDGTEDKTLEYYFETDGTVDINIITTTTNNKEFSTSLKTGVAAKSAEGVIGGILDPVVASLTPITDADYSLVDPTEVGTIGYELTGAPLAADYDYIEDIYVVETPSTTMTPIYHSVNSTGIEYFVYDGSVELDFEVFLTNGQVISKDITTTNLDAKDVRKDISLIYENVNSAMTIDKSGVTLKGVEDLPTFVSSSEIELENTSGTVATTAYSTTQAAEGYTFNFTEDAEYRLVAHTKLNNNVGAGDTSMNNPGEDVVFDTIIDDINGATMVDWVSGSGDAQGFNGYRSKQEDVDKVFSTIKKEVKAIDALPTGTEYDGSTGGHSYGFSIDSPFVVDPALTFTSSELILIDSLGAEYKVADITSDITSGANLKVDYYFNAADHYQIDDTYKLITHNTLDSGAVYDSVIFEGQQGYVPRTTAEVLELYSGLEITDPSGGSSYGVSVAGDYAKDTPWLASTDVQLSETTGSAKKYWEGEETTGTVNLTQNFEEDGTYKIDVNSTLISGQTTTNTLKESQGWLDRAGTIDALFDSVTAELSNFDSTLTISNIPDLATSEAWVDNLTLVVTQPDGTTVLTADSSTDTEQVFTLPVDGTYEYKFVINHANGVDKFETTPKNIDGYRLRTKDDVDLTFAGTTVELLGNSSSVKIGGPVDLTDDKITESTISLLDGAGTPVGDPYVLVDGSTAAATTADHTFDIPADGKYSVIANQTYSNGQTFEKELKAEFDGYLERDESDVLALFTDFTYTQPDNNVGTGSNYSSIDITGEFNAAGETWFTNPKIRIKGTTDTTNQQHDLVDGTNTFSFSNFDDRDDYMIEAEVTPNNGAAPIVTTTPITGLEGPFKGYTVRTSDDVKDIYDAKLIPAMGENSSSISIDGTIDLSGNTWVESAQLIISDTKGTPDKTDDVVLATSDDLTDTVSEVYTFTEDSTYEVAIHSTLTNTDEFKTVIWTGNGYVDRADADIETVYENLSAQMDSVVDATPPAGVTIDQSESNTKVTLTGELTIPEWIETSTLVILDSANAEVKTLDLKAYDGATGAEFAFTKDNDYKVKIETTLTNGKYTEADPHVKWLLGDESTGVSGSLYHGPVAVDSEYDLTAAIVDETTNTELNVKGTMPTATWIESSTLNLTRTDVVDPAFDTTVPVDGTWDAATGHTFKFPEDGTYSLTITSITNNGGQYTIDLGSFAGLKERDQATEVDILFDGLSLTNGAVDTTNGEKDTKVTVAGNVDELPSWVESAEIQLFKNGTFVTGSSKVINNAGEAISQDYEFDEDAQYTVNVHTVATNKQEFDTQIGTEITGYKSRTEDEIKAVFSTVKADPSIDTTNTTISVTGVPTAKEDYIRSASLELYMSDGTPTSTPSDDIIDITNASSGTQVFTYGEDGTFMINLKTTLTNDAVYSWTITDGDSLTGWATRDPATEVDVLFDGITTELVDAYSATDLEATDTASENTGVKISGSSTAADYLKSASINLLDSGVNIVTDATPITIGDDGTFTETTYAFPADDTYTVSVSWELENGQTGDTVIEESINGFHAYTKTEVEGSIADLTAAIDAADDSVIGITGDFTKPEYITSNTNITFGLYKDGETPAGVASNYVETKAMPETWDAATGVSFASVAEDGLYSVDAMIELTNGSTFLYQMDTGIQAYKPRTTTEIDAVFDTLTLATPSGNNTLIELSGELTIPNWIESATLSIKDSGVTEVDSLDLSTYSSTTGHSYSFEKDDTYSAVINVTTKQLIGGTKEYAYSQTGWDSIEGYKLISETEIEAAYGSLTAGVSPALTSIEIGGTLGDTSGIATSKFVLNRIDDTTGADDMEVTLDYSAGDTIDKVVFMPTIVGDYNVYIETTLVNPTPPTDDSGLIAKYLINDTPFNYNPPKDTSEFSSIFGRGAIKGTYNNGANSLTYNSGATFDWSAVVLPDWILSANLTLKAQHSSFSKTLGSVTPDGAVTSATATFDDLKDIWTLSGTKDFYYIEIEVILAEGTIINGEDTPDNKYTIPFTFMDNDDGWIIPMTGEAGGLVTEDNLYIEGWADLTGFDSTDDGIFSTLYLDRTDNTTSGKATVVVQGNLIANDILSTVNIALAKGDDASSATVVSGKEKDLTADQVSGVATIGPDELKAIGTPDPGATYWVRATSTFTAESNRDGEYVTMVQVPEASAFEAFEQIEYGYSEVDNKLTLTGDVKISDIENVNELRFTLFKDGEIYQVKSYEANSSRTITQSSNEDYIHIEEEFELTETGSYQLKVTAKTNDGKSISVNKGTQEVEVINEIEPVEEVPSGLGAFGWVSIIATITLLPMLIAFMITKLKDKK